METPNEGSNPFTGNGEGDTEQVRAGLYAALVEAIMRFLSTLGQDTKVDAKATRKANRYAKKDALKMGDLVSMVRFVGINARKVTQTDLLRTGLISVRGLVVNGKPFVLNTMDGLMLEALKVNQGVRRAAAAWLAFHQWEAADLAARQAMVAKSGQEAIEVPEGHLTASPEAMRAFGLKEGSFVRHVVIEAAAMLRESFAVLRDRLDGVAFVNAANIRTLNENGNTTHLDAESDAHLMLNLDTVMDWFASRVFATARYCSTCKRAGMKAVFGNQQVKTAGGCPQCGTPARLLGRNSNTAHLPFITTAKAGLKVIGGWRVSMTSFILPKATFNALEKAMNGLMPVEDAFAALVASRVDVRIQREGRTVKTKAALVPVCYEIVNGTGGHTLAFGLALEPLHQGDL
jgi:hypothetical protein